MSLVSLYESRLAAEGLTSDLDQLRVLDALQRLQDEVSQPQEKSWKQRLLRQTQPAARGFTSGAASGVARPG